MACWLKRVIDLVGATVGLILTSPLALVIAVLVRLDSPGPVLFWQTRVGQNGRLFALVKFRTMVVGAERAWRPPTAPEELDTFYFQDENDPRITRIGRWLRRTSLDELPNLWNVLRGDLSLVGPRPEVPEIVALYTPEQRARLRCRPGITGLAQVSGRGALSTADSIAYDLEYCRRWSLALDFWILARTVAAVFTGRGAR